MRTLKRIVAMVAAAAGLMSVLALTAAAEPRQTTGVVRADGGLNSRAVPSRYGEVQRVVPDRSKVLINCKTTGSIVGEGDAGNVWYLLDGEGDASWVSSLYVELTGDEPGWCGGGEYLTGTLTSDTVGLLGPSMKDEVYRRLTAGDSERVVCRVESQTGDVGRFVLTTEGDWIPGDTIKTEQEIPFCEL